MPKINYLDFPKEVKVRNKEYLTAIKRVLNSGVYILSSEVENFEKEFASYLGVKYCVGTANGLEAIKIALMALGVGKGDEVITTPISAVATTLAIIAVGATPIFADVNKRGQIDHTKIEGLITRRTKAILPVDLYGQPCDLVQIKEICKRHGLALIEDSAQAHGAFLNGRKLGTYGDIGCFSFYPTKNLGAFGDGGAIVTNNKKIDKIFRELRDYGQESKYVHIRYGLNSRLDELHAALLSEKLKHLDEDNKVRREIAKRYVSNLVGVDGIQIVLPEKLGDSNFHLFVITTDKRDELQKFLKDQRVPSLVHYPLTIPQQPVIKKLGIKVPGLFKSERFVKRVLSLPCHPFMTLTEVDYVSGVIKKFFSK